MRFHSRSPQDSEGVVTDTPRCPALMTKFMVMSQSEEMLARADDDSSGYPTQARFSDLTRPSVGTEALPGVLPLTVHHFPQPL